MNNSLFDRFKPKENKFFLLLRQMAEAVVKASDLIVECVQSADHDSAVKYYKLIKEQERIADDLQAEIFEELNETFITPFDREDINSLSERLDTVMDLINSCSKRMMLYSPKTMPEAATRLAVLVRESASYLIKAVDELEMIKNRPDKIKEYCVQLDLIENKADDVYEHFLIDLFENETDAIEVIKLKEILHELERATDAAEGVGKIIKTVIVKYS